jgi:hypothetical protein
MPLADQIGYRQGLLGGRDHIRDGTVKLFPERFPLSLFHETRSARSAESTWIGG